MLRLLTFLFLMTLPQILQAQDSYGIAPLERSAAMLTKWEAKAGQTSKAKVCSLEKKKIAAAPEPEKKAKKKRKDAKPAAVAAQSNYGYAAKVANDSYDPYEVLANGFTVTMWVMPYAKPAPGHGFVMYPLGGREKNGIGQSQWGMTVGKDCVRVYENYTSNKLILEYAHSEKSDFFIALTCKNNTPSLYINGVLVSTGTSSSYSPHPSLEGMASCPASMKFIGKSTAQHYFPFALHKDEIMGLYKNERAELHSVKSGSAK